ncbi:MAG: tetratricopeptide repeat protein, partial [Limisphaerales bacterium]
ALTQIDQEVAGNPDPDYKAKLLSLAGDCLFKQGKFGEAATVYAQVFRQVQDRAQAWLRPLVGQVRSLLKNVQVEEAQARAVTAMETALAHQQEYKTLLAQAQTTVATGGQAVIPARPPSPAEVANRLGKFFFAEGEPAAAKTLFQQALQLSPNSTQARLGLAEIALREGDGATVATLARQVIVLGLYRAKTLAAWNILLAAGRKTGTNVIDTVLLNGLAQATPSVRARAVLVLVRGLRNQNDARWQQVATNWLQESTGSNPTITAELRKLKSANTRLTNDTPANRIQAAQSLLSTANLSPNEWLSAAKEVVQSTLLQNQSPEISDLIAQAVNRFGPTKRATATHGLALACKKANRPDLATQLFEQNIATASGDDLGRSLSALGKLQSEQGNHVEAAASFWSYSQNAAFPARMRLYALLQWTREVVSANQPELVVQARPQIEAALPQITDYELVLDLSRQIRYSKLPRDFALQIFQRGQQLALQAFDATAHPSPAATILFKLCRRANDHAQYDAMIATWTRINDAKRQWLWSESNEYWQWLEHIFRAYRDNHRAPEAEQFIAPFLNDSATPAHGYATLGVSFAAMKRNQNDFTGMFSVYEKMAQVAPAHEWTSAAYYWFALRAWKQGNTNQSKTFADKMLLALGKDWKMYWKENMVACALCLKAGLDVSQIPAQTTIS